MSSISKRVASTVNIPQECLSKVPPVPKSVKIEITARCDLKCYFCAAAYRERDKGDIDPDLLFMLLDQVKEAGVREVGLFWMGEPFLNKALPEYIAYAKKTGIPYVFLTTNGRTANGETLARCFDSGLDSIKFSINARNREDFIKVCKVDGFDRVVKNIRSAWAFRGNRDKPALYASTVYDPLRQKDYREVDALISPFVDEHYPLRLYGDYAFSIDNRERIEQHEHNRTLTSMLPCWSLFTLAHISYDGFLSACFCDFDSRLFMADLKKSSFFDAWHSPNFVQLRNRHLKRDVKGSPCEDCIAYEH